MKNNTTSGYDFTPIHLVLYGKVVALDQQSGARKSMLKLNTENVLYISTNAGGQLTLAEPKTANT